VAADFFTVEVWTRSGLRRSASNSPANFASIAGVIAMASRSLGGAKKKISGIAIFLADLACSSCLPY
jgi:hypothetical protein